MSDLKVLSVQKRAGLGKGANRRARQEELIPGVFYTAKGENLPVQMSVRSFAKLFSQVGRTTVFNLEIEGDGTHPVLIWATQRDPITSRFTHIDFYGVDLDKPVKITVPVEFTGVARGTKVGGKLETYREQIQLMAKLSICPPRSPSTSPAWMWGPPSRSRREASRRRQGRL